MTTRQVPVDRSGALPETALTFLDGGPFLETVRPIRHRVAGEPYGAFLVETPTGALARVEYLWTEVDR